MGRKLFYAFVLVPLLLLAVALIALGLKLRGGGVDVPDRTVLEADFTGGLVEYVPEDPIAKAVLRERPSLRAITLALERAAEDDRVVALVARVGTGFGLPGKVQELRDAVLSFRSRGKRAIAYVETFGNGYGGTTNYYLATAFDEIHLLPIGSVNLSGLTLEVQFLRGALDKLGVEPQVDSRGEFKTAKNIYTDTELDAPNRESYTRIVTSQWDRIAEDIAAARGLTRERVEELAGRGTLQGRDAVEAGLIDGTAYRDEVFASVLADVPDGAERLALGAYAAQATRPDRDAPVIAVVYGVGAVVQGKSRYDPLSGVVTMGSDTVAGALRDAVEDPEVRAIVFRVDSGGGSAVASQVIWRETLRAKEKGKPVIVSMGDVAGSGGYFVAMGADKIVAQPGTITGSIGVVGGKLVTKGLWDRLGITFDEVETHRNAAMWNGIRGFTPEQWERFGEALDHVYEIFTEGVAEGRAMPLENVLAVAQGRIWTGADALELGLVDSLGGFSKAILLAKEAAGIDADEPVQTRAYPLEKSALELLVERLGGGGAARWDGAASDALLSDTLQRLRPLARAAAELGLAPRYGELQMRIPASLLGP